MTYAGARGGTARQMAGTLHFTLPQKDLHSAFNSLDLELARRSKTTGRGGDHFQLNIANSLWGQSGYSFLPDFLDLLARNYGAGLRLLDFAHDTERVRGVINEWISKETKGKIENLLLPGVLTPDTRLVLANAIYFNASWTYPFSEENTRDGKGSRKNNFRILPRDCVRFGRAD